MKGFGRHHRQCAAPIEPAAEQYKGHLCRMRGSAALDFEFLLEPELFAQEQILRGERAYGVTTITAISAIGNKAPEAELKITAIGAEILTPAVCPDNQPTGSFCIQMITNDGRHLPAAFDVSLDCKCHPNKQTVIISGK